MPSPLASPRGGAGSPAGPVRRGGAPSPLLTPVGAACGTGAARLGSLGLSPGLLRGSSDASPDAGRLGDALGGRSTSPRGVRADGSAIPHEENFGARARGRARGRSLSDLLSSAQEEPGRVEGMPRCPSGQRKSPLPEVQDGGTAHGQSPPASRRLDDVHRCSGRIPARLNPPGGSAIRPVHLGGRSLSVPCGMLRPGVGTTHVYKAHAASDGGVARGGHPLGGLPRRYFSVGTKLAT